MGNNIEQTQTIDSKYKELGGWLILIILGLLATVGLEAFNVYDTIGFFVDGTVDFMSDPSSEFYIVGYSSLMKFELILEILFLAAALYLICLFFRKNYKFPKLYIYFLLASVAYVVIEYIITSSLSVSTQEAKQIVSETLSEQGTEFVRSAIVALIWISYMKKSKRVKATFIKE